jgi:HlyD family secretion protein
MGNENSFGWSKWIAGALVLAGVGGGAAWFLHSRQEEPPDYQTSAVARGDLTQVVTATGQLGPVINVQVGSQVSGIIKKIYVDFNSTVKSNQVIAEIDPATYQVNVLKAKAGLANSKANLALAEVQTRRAESLRASNLISASDYDTTKAQLLQAQAQVESDEATLKNAEVQLSYCTIYAPVDGVVISRNVDVGQTVASSFNTPTLFLIANDLSKMDIDALVSEADIGGVAVGQDVHFSVDAYPTRSFEGRVSQVRYGAVTNQNVVNYDCVVTVDNSDLKLLPGMTANVSITVAQRANALKIPNGALRFRPPETAVSKTNTTTVASASQPAQGQTPAAGGSPRAAGQEREGGRRGDRQGGTGSGQHPRPERQLQRTIYILPATNAAAAAGAPKPQPVKIKIGITDGISTEVLDGLQEGDLVITGMAATSDASSAARPNNPFGGGGPPFRRF